MKLFILDTERFICESCAKKRGLVKTIAGVKGYAPELMPLDKEGIEIFKENGINCEFCS